MTLGAQGLVGSARVLREPGENGSDPQLAAEAQWFEDRMPWDSKYRKQVGHGITANAIDVVVESGGPLDRSRGRHQPAERSDIRGAVRQQSVSLTNVNESYDR